jgi:UDP-2,3-diacylglucosamine hydrolase
MNALASSPAADRRDEQATLGIFCGGGVLPFTVADAAIKQGRKIHLLGIRNWADPDAIRRYPHSWFALGQFGRVLTILRTHGCREIMFIGALLRPSLSSVRFDFATLRLLPYLLRAGRGGDDHLLTMVTRIFERHGFRMIGAHEIAPEILSIDGAYGARTPTADQLADAMRGFECIDAIAPFDIGQAVVVADRRVLAVEAAEGTDAMLTRIAALREIGRVTTPKGVGVLVKAAKHTQDRRFDLPSIGTATVELVARAGLAGIALRAGEVIVVDAAAVARAADAAKVFVVGLPTAPAVS